MDNRRGNRAPKKAEEGTRSTTAHKAPRAAILVDMSSKYADVLPTDELAERLRAEVTAATRPAR
jgi:hypothetical protein